LPETFSAIPAQTRSTAFRHGCSPCQFLKIQTIFRCYPEPNTPVWLDWERFRLQIFLSMVKHIETFFLEKKYVSKTK
jgi:hypothetical protein